LHICCLVALYWQNKLHIYKNADWCMSVITSTKEIMLSPELVILFGSRIMQKLPN